MNNMSLNALIENSVKKHWDLDALSDYRGETYQYKDVARIIEKLHIIFEQSDIKKGDKIALCGRNSANWGIAFFATVTYGAVAVPILPDFMPEQVHAIVNHSESKLLFVGDLVWKNLNADEMPGLDAIINIPDYSLLVCHNEKTAYARENLNKLFGERFPNKFLPEHISYYKDSPEEMGLLNYTSGTTSNSKGVMIPYRALWSNLDFAKEAIGKNMKAGDKVISMLPMAHMYGMAFEFLFEFTHGCHVYFLTKNPSPTLLFAAFAEIKPRLVVAVPLIIEKIIRKAVLPKIQGLTVRMLLKMPVISQKIKNKICAQLRNAFGGNFYEVIVGGAAFNREIEALLKDIGFNYTVGYGATECAPILSYADFKEFKLGSCGKAAPRMELKINSSDPENVVGEILAKGTNVMLGYYKNEEATAQTLIDGWYHTGDLGIIDKDGFVFIKGRSKNMLLGANGQNIYPEEIEDVLNNLTLVNESVVIQKGDKLYGLVYPDFEEGKKAGINTDEDWAKLMEQNRTELNSLVPPYAKLTGIKIMQEEFEKTPKRSIKRFKYTNVEI
ncbi:MAG: AMP-binding protein [Paraprevotella sp.]|nr:AMP-binding protein [Paraprevotella sp.]